MSFSDTFAQPFPRAVNGKTYTVKLLTTRDYLDWMAELTTQHRTAFKAEIPDGVGPQDRFTLGKAIALYEVTPDTLLGQISTGPGTIRVLEMAGKKAGITDPAELQAFVDGEDPRRNLRDAYRASALLTAELYLSYFPEELPPDDTIVVLGRIATASAQTRAALADALVTPSLTPQQLQSKLAATIGIPDAPKQETPDPNPPAAAS